MAQVPSKKGSKRPFDDDTDDESVRYPFLCDVSSDDGPDALSTDEKQSVPESDGGTRSHANIPRFTNAEAAYLDKIEKLLFDDSTDVGLLLDHLKESPGISYVVPGLPFHLCTNLKSEEAEKAFISLQALQCLLLNDCFRLSADLVDAIADALLFCLVDPSSKCNQNSRCYFLKDVAADVLSQFLGRKGTLRIWGDVLNKLADAFTDHNKPFIVHYGAVVASLSLGPEAVSKVLLPHFDEYFEYVHDRILCNVPSRNGALRVRDKLVLVCENLTSCWSQSEHLTDGDCERVLRYVTDDLAMRFPLKNTHTECECAARKEPLASDILLEMFDKLIVGSRRDADEMDFRSSSGDRVPFDSSIASDDDTSDSQTLRQQSSGESSGDDGARRYTSNSTEMTEVGLSPSLENSTNHSKPIHDAGSVPKSEKNESSNLFFETGKNESFETARGSKTNVLSTVPCSLTVFSEPAEKSGAGLLGKTVFF